MNDSNSPPSQAIFSLCQKLYIDPIYRYIYHPGADSSETLSEELFARVWQMLHDPDNPEKKGVEHALARTIETVRKLEQIEQTVLLLRFVEGRSYSDIGRLVNKSEGACHVIYYRALSAISSLMSQSQKARDYAYV